MVKKAESLIETPGKMQDKRGAKKYVKNPSKDRPSLDLKKIDADSQWDGFYGIQTSDVEITQDEVMDAYKNLWRIEEIFRTLKSTLETRPMFHWTPDRIKGHLVACFLSFVFERTIELKISENKKIHLSPDAIQEALSKLQMSDIKIEGKSLYLRSVISKDAELILSTLEIKPPKTAEFRDSAMPV